MPDQQLLRSYIDAGLHAYNHGNIEAAKEAFKRALTIAPDHPDALNLYGVTLLQLGQPAAALEYLQRAAHSQRNNPAVVGNLAQAYFMLERYDDAHATFRKASRLDPRAVQFALGAANSLAMQGRFDVAAEQLQKLAARFPQSALVWFNLGNVQRDQQRATDALESFRHAVALDPQLVVARNNLADVLHKQLRFEEAEREYRECIRSAPDYLLARCNLASVVIDLGRFDEAATLCRDIIVLAPELPLAHSFLGATLGHQGPAARRAGEPRRRRHGCRRATRKSRRPMPQRLPTAATSWRDCSWFARALALDPELNSTHQLLAFALLGHGCFSEGWAQYTHRPWPATFRAEHPHIALTQKLPADLNGKHVHVMREQGLGDEIFFLRFAPQLHCSRRASYLLRERQDQESARARARPRAGAGRDRAAGGRRRDHTGGRLAARVERITVEPVAGNGQFRTRAARRADALPHRTVLAAGDFTLGAHTARRANCGNARAPRASRPGAVPRIDLARRHPAARATSCHLGPLQGNRHRTPSGGA